MVKMWKKGVWFTAVLFALFVFYWLDKLTVEQFTILATKIYAMLWLD